MRDIVFEILKELTNIFLAGRPHSEKYRVSFSASKGTTLNFKRVMIWPEGAIDSKWILAIVIYDEQAALFENGHVQEFLLFEYCNPNFPENLFDVMSAYFIRQGLPESPNPWNILLQTHCSTE